jgi:hypothetical protein
MKDDAGYTIPAGTFVSIRDDVGNEVPFATVQEVTIPAGEVATIAGDVQLQALTPGAAASGLGGVGVPASLTDILEFVQSVVLAGPTSGGEDPESPQEYNDKIATHLRRLSTRPILPEDFASMASEIPGVYRAVAIDGYDPATQTYNNERMIAISAIDENGNTVSSLIRNQIDALLEENRETNFVVNVILPVETVIDATFSGKALTGYDPDAVEADVIEALQDYLSKARWGRDPVLADVPAGDQTWVEDRYVRYNKMLKIAMNVQGVDYITTFLIGIQGTGLSNIDIQMPGAAPLATPGLITGLMN